MKMAKSLKDEIVEQIELLDASGQRRVLDFARLIAPRAGTRGSELTRFAGSIPVSDLHKIAQAIEDACESIEPNAW